MGEGREGGTWWFYIHNYFRGLPPHILGGEVKRQVGGVGGGGRGTDR